MLCLQSLYKGLGVVALMTSLGSGVYFTTYEFCKKHPSLGAHPHSTPHSQDASLSRRRW